MSIGKMTARELGKLLQSKQLSAYEAAEAYHREIASKDADIHAFLQLSMESAFAAAKKVDEMRQKNESLHPLAGIPFAAKDNLCARFGNTTCGSKMLCDFSPGYDATAIANLQLCGGILLGKTNMDAFGMGSSTEHSFFGATRNPHDVTRIPGGSSGGSAAAVAANMIPYSLGTDTGGSVRQPAAMCGVVGFVPTYGAVSRYGLVAFASSLDRVGVLAKDVTDAAYVMHELILPDRYDATQQHHPERGFITRLYDGVKGMKIALPQEYFSAAVSGKVKAAVLSAAREFARLGAVVEEVSLPTTDAALAAYYILSSAEASSNLARYDGIRFGHRAKSFANIEEMYQKSRSEGFSDEVKRRILFGTLVLSREHFDAYYRRAKMVQEKVKREFSDIFAHYDLILTPTAPKTAWRLSQKLADPQEMYAEDVCTVPSSLAGLPAISVCCGSDASGLPIGLQLIGKPFDEGTVLKAAYAYERRGEA